MSDLVKRLRGQKVMDPARGLMCSPTREEEEAADRIEELEGIVRDLIEQVGRTSLELTQIGPAVLAGREPCMKEAKKMDALLTKARAALGE